jgi:hypothetical protein
MKMGINKFYYLIIILNVFTIKCAGQNETLLPWLNESMEFKIVLISSQYDLENMIMTPSKYVFDMELSASQIDSIRVVTYKEWMFLLEDIERYFLVNVLLNFLFEKDIYFSTIKERREWFFNNEDEEIDEWKFILTENFPLRFD